MYSKILLLATLLTFDFASAAPAEPSPGNGTTAELAPAIKGLSIGMDFSRLKQWFAEKLKDTSLGYEILPEGNATVFLIARSDLLDYMRQQSGSAKITASGREQQLRLAAKRLISNGMAVQENPSFIMADSAGKVAAITIRPDMVNYLFHASDLSAGDFSKQFAGAYNLTWSRTSDDRTSDTCTTPQGVKITVASDKTVFLKRVAAPADVKAAFD